MPFAPLRQKIVAAMQSGVLPDAYVNQPTELVSLHAWDDKLVDVSDVVATQREEFSETALVNMNCYNNVTKKRSLYGVPYNQGTLPNHVGGHWSRRPASRWRTSRRPGMPITISSKKCRKSCAPK